MTFTISFSHSNRLIFSTQTRGVIVDGKEFIAGVDGVLVYDKAKGLSSNEATCQYSTNTSTLIPALRILGIAYHPYFEKRPVVESQNDITFYWKPSRLATFYNRYETDGLPYEKRKPVIQKAVKFLMGSAKQRENFLPEEMLKKLKEPSKLLGFYEGFPIFDATRGMPKLLSSLGIHVGSEAIMVSTPMNRYARDIEEMTRKLEHATGLSAMRKKNRAVFSPNAELFSVFGLSMEAITRKDTRRRQLKELGDHPSSESVQNLGTR